MAIDKIASDLLTCITERTARICIVGIATNESRRQGVAVELSTKLVEAQDLVVIATPHAAFDWNIVRKGARAVLDTRGWSRSQEIPNWHTL